MKRPAKKHVFDPEFLEWLATRDRGGPTCAEAEYAGPWTVRRRPSGFAVMREADDEEMMPDAELLERETALLLAAVYPVLGREQRYGLVASERGAKVTAAGGGRLREVGWLRHEHPEILEALNVAEWFLRSPSSLALMLEAADYEVVSQAGRILARRLSESEEA